MRKRIFSLLLILVSFTCSGQQIHLVSKLDASKTRSIRTDKRVMIKTFNGEKFKGELQVLDDGKLRMQGREINKDNVMMISGFVQGNSKDRALGIGLTVGAGIIFPVAVYYFLGGIAWGFPNGIFVGATLLVFDLVLAYAGTSMLGFIPRRFSTFNWEIESSSQPVPILFPAPVD